MEPEGDDVLLIEQRGAVRLLTINRPHVGNALNAELFAALQTAVLAVQDSAETRSVLLRSAGTGPFCAGADLAELARLGPADAYAYMRRGQRVTRLIEQTAVPIIAASQGVALGGGCELLLACTLVVASERARFGLPEASLGLIPGYGGTQRLSARVGSGVALAAMLADRRIDATRAHELGLLAVAPATPEALEATALELAEAIAARSRTAVQAILQAHRVFAAGGSALEHETTLAADAIISPDGAEGIAAFLAKRAPRFVS